ncbi:MAG: 50S ribosomal protein P1 [Thermoprotei archaeon]|nr:MAG: 50S ribosomal protein P1 [Thermoprotei archaeon]RLF18628.1 MAG: 50S ribosomal protein P1 [Thermoprotei archaeon]
MEYVYAALLLHHAKKGITEEGLKSILESAGVEVDEVRVKALVAALKEVNIDEAIKAAALPVVAPAAVAAGTAPATQPSGAPAEEEKKEEEKKEEVSEETMAEGLSALFG